MVAIHSFGCWRDDCRCYAFCASLLRALVGCIVDDMDGCGVGWWSWLVELVGGVGWWSWSWLVELVELAELATLRWVMATTTSNMR